MGDPRKPKKKYVGPGHPWEAGRLDEEAKLTREYGLSNKREIYKMRSLLRNWRQQARDIIGLSEPKRADETKKFIGKLADLGLLSEKAQLDEALALTLKDIMERRLQTVVYKKGFANTIKQARQFIIHGKVKVNGKTLAAPTHMTKNKDNVQLIGGFTPKLVPVTKEVPKETVVQNG